ncbi:TIGR03557 family F420-dependent LLM class oxidoreductase [Microbacterium resistens]
MIVGYHASHEQFGPDLLRDCVIAAERAGFDAAMCSDHLAPWGARQGESGFAWAWLGAVLQATSLPLGVVTAPGYRYHPAVIAQAVATVELMFPGRFWAALGSGEAVNEHVTALPWPAKPDRDRAWEATARSIRELLRGQVVTALDPPRIDRARVWSLPPSPPPLLAAAVSPAAAARAAGWADGLITVAPQPDPPERVLAAFRDAGGRGRAVLQVHVCLAESESLALAAARDQWRHSAVPADRVWDLALPEEFDAHPAPDDDALRSAVVIDTDAGQLAERILDLARGFDEVQLHQVARDQLAFIDRAGSELLPALRSAA